MLPTADTLARAVGCGRVLAERWTQPLRHACGVYEVDTGPRLAAFLAQTGHESAGLSRTIENLNYSADGLRKTWPSRFDEATAQEYARQPERIANRVYANRMGNGPEASGDGWKYRGRGLIMNTGRANYEAITELIRQLRPTAPDFATTPEALAVRGWAALAAGAYWFDHDLNTLADAGEFSRITARINGGNIGASDRNARYAKALQVFV